MRQFHWKIEGYMWQSTHAKRGLHSPRRKKYGSESLQHLRQSQINTSGTVPQIKQNQVKAKQGRKSSELKKTAGSSKVSLSEKIPIEQIEDTSI